MSVVIPGDLVEKAREVLHARTMICDMGSDTCDAATVAREMLEAVFAGINTIGVWWLGTATTHDDVDIVVVVKQRKDDEMVPSMIVLRNKGNGLDFDQVDPRTMNFNFNQGRVSGFQITGVE